MSAREQIQQILAARRKYSEQVSELEKQWETRKERKKALEKCWNQIKSKCQLALQSSKPEAEEFRKLLGVLEQFGSSRLGLISYCEQAERMLGQLKERFQRSTINIAVAGIGRCGKSTTLKSILASKAEDIDDNTIIPTGENSAVTAGKSTVCCIGQDETPYTKVVFHSRRSFLDEVINPQLQSMMLGAFVCSTLEDFEHLDFDLLRETLDGNKKSLEQMRKNADEEGNSDEVQKYQNQIDVINQSYNRLEEMRKKIHANFADYVNYLREESYSEDKDLSETAKYISYPQERGQWPVYCYAVKECFIYTHFPNNEVESLRLIDLPGLGTDSLMEEKCFLAGFDYSVDLALVIRRPEGLAKNVPTTEDTRVFNTLNKAFPTRMSECTVLFQNDANITSGNPDTLYQELEEWNQRNYQLNLLRGDAKNFTFVQQQLLPEILQFVAAHLPDFDNGLLDEKKKPLEERGKEFDKTYDAILQALKKCCKGLPDDHDANKLVDLAEEVSDALMIGVDKIRKCYEEGDPEKADNEKVLFADKFAEEIYSKKARLKEYAEKTYSPENEEIMTAAELALTKKETGSVYAVNELHKIRILISEEYSDLEHFYEEFIAEIYKKIGDILQKSLARAEVDLDAEKPLDDFCERAREISECGMLINAIQNLLDLQVPFYTTLYPALRKQVFADIEATAISYGPSLSPEEVIRCLQVTMVKWAGKTVKVLLEQPQFLQIICASLERFIDVTTRDEKKSRKAFIAFIQQNRGKSNLSGIAESIRKLIQELPEN